MIHWVSVHLGLHHQAKNLQIRDVARGFTVFLDPSEKRGEMMGFFLELVIFQEIPNTLGVGYP